VQSGLARWCESGFSAAAFVVDVTVAPLTIAAMVLTYSVEKVLNVANFVEFCRLSTMRSPAL
jgi:hypothetical protein